MAARATGTQVGRLWTSLADYYIRRGMFEKARDIYEEGLTSGEQAGAHAGREAWGVGGRRQHAPATGLQRLGPRAL